MARDPSTSTEIFAEQSNAFVMNHLKTRAVLCRHYVTPHGYEGTLHRHVGLEIIYCQSGQGALTVGEQTVPYHAGHLLYFDCQVPHKVKVEGEYRRWGLCFWPESLDGESLGSAPNDVIEAVRPAPDEVRVFRVPPSQSQRLERHFEDLRDEVEAQRPDLRFILPLHLLELHILLKRFQYHIVSPAVPSQSRSLWQRVAHVLNYIESNLAGPLSSEELADTFHYSASHLNRLVRQATGRSLTEYVRTRRMERAKRLLVQTDMSVTAIAGVVGIPNVAYFCRSFREATGQTPGEFRARHDEQAPMRA